MSAAAASAEFRQNVESTIPILEQLALDEFQTEEVKLEVALQLAPLGKHCILMFAVVDCMLWPTAQSQHVSVSNCLRHCR